VIGLSSISLIINEFFNVEEEDKVFKSFSPLEISTTETSFCKFDSTDFVIASVVSLIIESFSFCVDSSSLCVEVSGGIGGGAGLIP